MRLTLIHPTIGRHKEDRQYIRGWQMEPLAPALLAGLTPSSWDIRFYDDRMEGIPYEEETDLVALSVETYTAKRAYQIASEYRRRSVPVVMGGFHATLVPEEVSQYAEAIVIGEAEGLWQRVLEDFQQGQLRRVYKQAERPSLERLSTARSIFAGKNYLPLGLIEAGRGCHFRCDFCAIQAYFSSTQNRRPSEDIFEELRCIKKPLIFFVDDNISSNMEQAKAFFEALIPLKIKWVSQVSINAAHDEEFLRIIKASGCQGVLIGFESLNETTLRKMKKGFNVMNGGYEKALANLRKYEIRLYSTFIFGYDEDTLNSFEQTLTFAQENRFYMVAFNHLTPFPGTPLYERLQAEERLVFDKWWLDENYRYGMVPFYPHQLTPKQVRDGCLDLRRRFYTWSSIFNRSLDFEVNSRSLKMWLGFWFINYLLRQEVSQREDFPLGDESFVGDLVTASHHEPFDSRALANELLMPSVPLRVS
jgi:radical SAM superfamily enzyme YgiQ (UPF0313 family)